ncbi:DUF221-domain-containing protein, partial [Aureobasidium melanogenum]
MDPNTIAIGNGSAQQDYGNSFDGFLASIQVGAFVAAVQIGGFVILRRRYRGKWNIRSFYTIFYDLDSSCLDAIGLFALLRLLTRIFGLTAIFMVPLLVPLNYVHRQSDSSIHGLDKFSCLNILEGNTGRLWTHLIATYWFTGLFCLLSRRELANFVDIRHMHDSGTASRFYLVTDIPNRLGKDLMESMFHKLYACQVRLHTTRDNKTPFVDGQPYLRALTQIEKEACREEHKKAPENSHRTRQRLVRCFQRMQEYLTKPYVEYDFSSLAILKIFEADSAIVRDVMPQTIWPLHTYPVSEALDCINWLNARKPRAQRTVINIIMTVFSLGLSVVLALPVTFSASLGQIEDLTQNISWLYWVNRIPPRALAYLQGAVPQLLVAAVVALVPSLLRYLSSWHCHVTHAQAEIAYYRYYSAFLFLQAFLLVSISSSLMLTLSEVLNKPSAIPRVLALNLPKAGNYFISFLTLQGFSLFADMIAQWAYLLKRTFKSRFLSSTPRHLAAVASQDSFSITGMYSTVALLGVIGRLGKFIGTWFSKLTSAATVYSIITPLALLPSSLGLFALLMATKPALRRFKENAASTNGEIFSNVINQLFVGLYIMQLCLAGIFISVESKTARFAYNTQTMYIENGLLDNLAELHLDDFDPLETGSSDGQSIDRVHRGEEKKKKMDADSTQKRFQRRDEGTYVIIGDQNAA